MQDAAARGVGDAITQLVHLSLLDLAGVGTAVTQREALRERIKQHVTRAPGRPAAVGRRIAWALNCSRRHLYNAFAEEPDGVAGYVLRRAWKPAAASTTAPGCHRSITDDRARFGFSSMAHFSRVFRPAPRRRAERLPKRGRRLARLNRRRRTGGLAA